MNDAAIAPIPMSFEKIDHARSLGATLLRNTEVVVGFDLHGGKIRAAT